MHTINAIHLKKHAGKSYIAEGKQTSWISENVYWNI